MITCKRTGLEGCLELDYTLCKDSRGQFIKTYHAGLFQDLGLNTDWREEYYSNSHQGVLRGLHFQLPPQAHYKLVYCTSGRIMDVAVDLRRASPTFGRHYATELSPAAHNALYLAPGFAHGFYVHSQEALVHYMVSSVYAPEQDTGILWNSAGIAWPDADPLLSERDKGFPSLENFPSPF